MDPNDDEAPKDPGSTRQYTEKDFEGHRAHTVFVGLHVPGSGKRHHRRHRHHGKGDGSASSSFENDFNLRPRTGSLSKAGRRQSVGEDAINPSQRVQFILGEEVDDKETEAHPLFSEMEELVGAGDELEWKETARWVKFEEDVEEGGNRWSKPHVATLSLHSLFELRSLLLNGTMMLDTDASTLEQIADLVCDNMISGGSLPRDASDKVREALLRRHRHQHEREGKKNRENNMSRLPIIRSLTEIGRNQSASKMDEHHHHNPSSGNLLPTTTSQSYKGSTDNSGNYLMVPGKDVADTSSGSNMVPSLSSTSMPRNLSSNEMGNGESSSHRLNHNFMRKIPPGAEASNILVGEVDFLEKTLSAFVRLREANIMGDLTEVPVPTRFLFILLGPPGSQDSFHEIGRAMATLMSDEIFHEVAYKAKKRDHILAGVDEFLDAVTVLPPGEWDPAIRIEPPAAIPSQEVRKSKQNGGSVVKKELINEEEHEARLREESGLSRTGKWFGGLRNDVKRKVPFYWSDFKEAMALQCVASWIFLYFACLSPIITFGGLLSQATGKNMAAMESLISGFVCGIGYGFFSGQPLTILGSTGPVLVFETIVYDFCQEVGWDYMSFRFWIGAWIALILLILVAIDASALVCYITRFTEENFACLIAFIFIYKAVENVFAIGKQYPVNPEHIYDCLCYPPNSTALDTTWAKYGNGMCQKLNGRLIGEDCSRPDPYHTNVFPLSLILFVGTFTMSIILKDFKNALFFPANIRQVISDFSVIIAIFSMSLLDLFLGVDTPKLEVPNELKPTLADRGWLIYPFNGNPTWSALAAVLPALLGTILIFMDQQITAVIVNRKENKLKKGCGYHLDLFILAILIQICSVMGLPWFVAATVLSISHVNSLKLESETAAPGEKPQFLGVREQRVTHILIFLMIGCSVLLTPLLSHIPMPVLFGVFLYMGVSSLKGLQFFDRIMIMLMPVKYQPDYMFLRQVPLKRVHLFTLIQLACLTVLWVIKSFSRTSILFPLMLVVMIGIRKSLDCLFTRRELKILDDVMPEMTRRAAADDMKDLECASGERLAGGAVDRELSGPNLRIPLPNGNIMKIPLATRPINISEEVDKTAIWKNMHDQKEDKDDSGKRSNKYFGMSNKKHKNIKKKSSPKTDKRLTTMTEEEENLTRNDDSKMGLVGPN